HVIGPFGRVDLDPPLEHFRELPGARVVPNHRREDQDHGNSNHKIRRLSLAAACGDGSLPTRCALGAHGCHQTLSSIIFIKLASISAPESWPMWRARMIPLASMKTLVGMA